MSDSSKAVIAGASVAVINEGTGAQRRFTTDASGIYVAAELSIGYYTAQFEARGLSPVKRQGIKVDVGGETRVDVTLSVVGNPRLSDKTNALAREAKRAGAVS